MKSDSSTVGNRIMLTVAIVVIVIILLACVGYLSGRWEAWAQFELQSAQPPLVAEIECIPTVVIKSQMRVHMLNGLDHALEDRTQKLFDVWMGDPSTDQPKRASEGLHRAIRAYVYSRQQIEFWDPPICPN